MKKNILNTTCETLMSARHFCILTIFSIMVICSCSHSFSKINSVEFVPVNFSVILEDSKSVISQPSIAVSYNKYYNESALPAEFRSKYSTDTISYKKQMAVECFLGNQNKFKDLGIKQIKENKDEIRIYFNTNPNQDSSKYYQPFIIAKMHKTRKKVKFYLNEKDLATSLQNIYVK